MSADDHTPSTGQLISLLAGCGAVEPKWRGWVFARYQLRADARAPGDSSSNNSSEASSKVHFACMLQNPLWVFNGNPHARFRVGVITEFVCACAKQYAWLLQCCLAILMATCCLAAGVASAPPPPCRLLYPNLVVAAGVCTLAAVPHCSWPP